MRLRIGYGGWVIVDDLDLPGPLYVRAGGEDTNGRLRITEFYLDASGNRETSIADGDIRDLPLSAIESIINTQLVDAVRRRLDFASPDLSTLASYADTQFGNYHRQIEERNWVVISYAAQFSKEDYESGGFPKITRAPHKTRKSRVRDVDSEYTLDSGPVNGLTDDFLQKVARAYSAAMVRGERPNVSIAHQLGGRDLYPLKTVQRWVYEARQRGIMPPGSKGRPG